MPAVTIYTKSWCPYCSAAKDLLVRKNVSFTEFDITGKADLRDEMVRRSGRAGQATATGAHRASISASDLP
jgi:glutaredoxin 3